MSSAKHGGHFVQGGDELRVISCFYDKTYDKNLIRSPLIILNICREIAEAFNGLLPMLDIDSHCPCPDDYPQALDSETDVDVWCAKNYNTSLRTLRLLRSEQASGGFFLNEALVDGVTDFYRDDDKSVSWFHFYGSKIDPLPTLSI